MLTYKLFSQNPHQSQDEISTDKTENAEVQKLFSRISSLSMNRSCPLRTNESLSLVLCLNWEVSINQSLSWIDCAIWSSGQQFPSFQTMMVIHYHLNLHNFLLFFTREMAETAAKCQKSKNWVQAWCNTVNSWAKSCSTSQIASQWAVWDHKTISSEKLYSTSEPNTKYCQRVSIVTVFHLKELGHLGTFHRQCALFFLPTSSADKPTVLPQFVEFSYWQIMIFWRNFNQKSNDPAHSSLLSQETGKSKSVTMLQLYLFLAVQEGRSPPEDSCVTQSPVERHTAPC